MAYSAFFLYQLAMTNTFFITPLSTSSHLWVLVSFNAAKCGQILSDAEAKSFGDLKKINSQWEITPKLKWNNSDIAFKIYTSQYLMLNTETYIVNGR